MEKYITALEITSSCIKLLVGYYYEKTVYVLHALESDKAFLVNGRIQDEEEMADAIKELVGSASASLGMPITSVVLGLPSLSLKVVSAKAETMTTDPESHIQNFDGVNLITMIAKQKKLADNEKTVDVVPYEYYDDDAEGLTAFPLGKRSRQLGMKADVEINDALLYRTFENAVHKADLTIDKIVDITNATVKYISSFQPTSQEFIFIDIGEKMSTIGHSYGGRLFQAQVVRFGKETICESVAKELGIPLDKAREGVELYGISKEPPFAFKTKEGYTLTKLSEAIIHSLSLIEDSISTFELSISESARNLFLMSGEGSTIFGLEDQIAAYFKNHVVLFTPNSFGARNRAYTHCLALVAYYATYPIKPSPQRPVDLTLTRMNPVVGASQNGNVNRHNDNPDNGRKDEPSPLDSGDEIL